MNYFSVFSSTVRLKTSQTSLDLSQLLLKWKKTTTGTHLKLMKQRSCLLFFCKLKSSFSQIFKAARESERARSALTCRVDVGGQREPNQNKPQNLKPAWSWLLSWACPARNLKPEPLPPLQTTNPSPEEDWGAEGLRRSGVWMTEKMWERKSCRMWLQLRVPLWKWSVWMQIQFRPHCGRSRSGPPPQRNQAYMCNLCVHLKTYKGHHLVAVFNVNVYANCCSDGGEPWNQHFERKVVSSPLRFNGNHFLFSPGHLWRSFWKSHCSFT